MVKRLRHRPFTAVTRVRFPVGSPDQPPNCNSSEVFIFLFYCENSPDRMQRNYFSSLPKTESQCRPMRSRSASEMRLMPGREILCLLKASMMDSSSFHPSVIISVRTPDSSSCSAAIRGTQATPAPLTAHIFAASTSDT